MATDIIIHDKKDNVGVVVIDKITPKQDCDCWIMEDDSATNAELVFKTMHLQDLHKRFLCCNFSHKTIPL